jgi:hypothetical protein
MHASALVRRQPALSGEVASAHHRRGVHGGVGAPLIGVTPTTSPDIRLTWSFWSRRASCPRAAPTMVLPLADAWVPASPHHTTLHILD